MGPIRPCSSAGCLQAARVHVHRSREISPRWAAGGYVARRTMMIGAVLFCIGAILFCSGATVLLLPFLFCQSSVVGQYFPLLVLILLGPKPVCCISTHCHYPSYRYDLTRYQHNHHWSNHQTPAHGEHACSGTASEPEEPSTHSQSPCTRAPRHHHHWQCHMIPPQPLHLRVLPCCI